MHGQETKMKQIHSTHSIYCRPSNGPIFGNGFDLFICDLANTTASCSSSLGNSYHHPQPSQGKSYLAGAEYFQLSEIEVYQKK